MIAIALISAGMIIPGPCSEMIPCGNYSVQGLPHAESSTVVLTIYRLAASFAGRLRAGIILHGNYPVRRFIMRELIRSG